MQLLLYLFCFLTKRKSPITMLSKGWNNTWIHWNCLDYLPNMWWVILNPISAPSFWEYFLVFLGVIICFTLWKQLWGRSLLEAWKYSSGFLKTQCWGHLWDQQCSINNYPFAFKICNKLHNAFPWGYLKETVTETEFFRMWILKGK